MHFVLNHGGRGAAFAGALLAATALASASASADPVETVFVIAMENHNWVQPANQFNGNIQQIFQNPAAPFINSLVGGTASALVNGVQTNISAQTAYATSYHNVLANAQGSVHIHPSEPSYIWSEAGTNFGVLNDNTPFGNNGTNQNTTQHLSGLLQQSGKTWKSYQEDTDLARDANNKLTNTVLPQNQWTVPLNNVSGSNPGAYQNAYNGAAQYDYAAKHDPQVFFTDTNGGNNTTPSNPLSSNYAPLQQLTTDLANNTVANYNWITPNQFNDQHTTLTGGYKNLTGDAAKIRQGDDFLAQIIPLIMASNAYKNNGAIILWWDETEQDGVPGDNPDDLNHTIGEIVISLDAHPNVNGLPYASTLDYTHSSDLRTMQEIFQVAGDGGTYLGDAANARDLSDLFAPGAINNGIPEPATPGVLALGLGILALARRQVFRRGAVPTPPC